jgi:molybdopterin-containing oxidoreductase family iron-sulfur binding subunit
MDNNRRTFLKIAGVSAALGLGGGIPLSLQAYAPEDVQYVPAESQISGKRWGMVIDTRKFTTPEDFQRVIEACHHTHNVPDIQGNEEIKWIWTDHFEHVFPSSSNPYLAERYEQQDFLLLCNHCNNPPCVRVCPTKATFQRADGIIMMDFHRCIGCRYCMAGCPYGSRSFNFRDPKPYVQNKNPDFPARMRGVVEKCTFCAARLEQGQMPACVEASNGAIIFGDLSDPDAEIRKVLREHFTIRRKVELGTNPCVFYIV